MCSGSINHMPSSRISRLVDGIIHHDFHSTGCTIHHSVYCVCSLPADATQHSAHLIPAQCTPRPSTKHTSSQHQAHPVPAQSTPRPSTKHTSSQLSAHLSSCRLICLQHIANLGAEHAVGGLPEQSQHGLPALYMLCQAVQQLQALLVEQGLLLGLGGGEGHFQHHRQAGELALWVKVRAIHTCSTFATQSSVQHLWTLSP